MACMMMTPANRADVRRYFCEVYAKWRRGDPLDAMEALLSAWMQEHPEYHTALAQAMPPQPPQATASSPEMPHAGLHTGSHAEASAAVPAETPIETPIETPAEHAGGSNPFLHLSMHLALSEQCSIDRPRGIRLAVEQLAARLPSLHAAHHAAMDCLGEMIAQSQRSGQPPDGDSYLACVQRKATRR